MTEPNHIKVSTALLARAGRGLVNGLRAGAKVPTGQPFAPTVGQGIRRTLKLGFNPEVPGWAKIPKRLLQGSALYGLAATGVQARSTVQNLANNANQLIPDTEGLHPIKQWTGELARSPIWTTLKAVATGPPENIPTSQRSLLSNATYIAGRNGLADWWNSIGRSSTPQGPETWLRRAYMPAALPAAQGVRKLLPDMSYAPPSAYFNFLRAAHQTGSELLK